MSRMSEEQKKRAREMKDSGSTWLQIQQELRVPMETIRYNVDERYRQKRIEHQRRTRARRR